MKYVSKNSDVGEVSVTKEKYCGMEIGKNDFLRKYASSHIASASEAFFSMQGSHRYQISPPVTLLQIHLEGKKIICMPLNKETNQTEEQHQIDNIPLSKLERYFLRPDEEEFNDLKYCDYYCFYSINTKKNTDFLDKDNPPFRVSKKNKRSYCAIKMVNPSDHEKFALRLLLMNKPARSYDELKTINENIHISFYEEAMNIGLIINNLEFQICLDEAIEIHRPLGDLRFMIVLFSKQGAPYFDLLEHYHDYLVSDLGERSLNSEIAKIFDQMQLVLPPFLDLEAYDLPQLINDNFSETSLNKLQNYALKTIFDILCSDKTPFNLMFLQGRAGTGKTYTANVIINT